MVNIVSRMRKLRELLWIRVGPGAIILPKEVSKIAMEFNTHINGGHMGARKFWRDVLPRIKFRNPALPISITRHNDDAGPAKLYIYTKESTSAPSNISTTPSSAESSPPSTTPNPRNTATPDTSTPTYTIDLKMVNESQILAELVAKTGATAIETTEEEAQELRDIAEFKARAEVDRADVREKLMRKRREEELLRLARGEVGVAA